MIERLGASATGEATQGIQPVKVRAVPGVLDSRPELLVHGASLVGETNWIGAMNAFRIARTLETQQQLLATTKPDTALSDQIANASKRAPITHDNGLLRSASQAGEPSLIPAITQMDVDHEASNDSGTRLDLGRENRLFAGANRDMAEVVTNEETEVALFYEAGQVIGTEIVARQIPKPLSVTAKHRPGGDPPAIATKAPVFRGHLIRLGQTSQFVLKLPT